MSDVLGVYRDKEYGLEELVGQARFLLERAAFSLDDERVAEYPDARTIRYYQTIGVVSKPLRYKGRRAVYGYLHLLQVVATKLLQAQGHSLAQIQKTLLGSSIADLEAALDQELNQVPRIQERDAYSKAYAEPKLFPSAPAVQSSAPRAREIHEFSYQEPEEVLQRSLVAAEVARGVTVIIDSEVIRDPEALISKIQKIINGEM